MRRERIFLILALLIPVALFGALELGARIFWPEGRSPLFVPPPIAGGRYLVANPRIASRWFPREAEPPGPSTELMRREKPANGFRVFVLGESAAQGFPYPRTGAFSRALAPMLRDAFPTDSVEVINLGIAATNSFSMLDLVPDILAHAPDAIVYYGGHNEYYGAFGAGSSVRLPGSDGMARLYLRLQRLRSVKLAAHLIAKARSRGAVRDPAAEANFMGVVARDRAIALDERVYERGIAQYEGNLTRIVGKFRAAGVPVYLAGVASNERDLAPFSSPLNTVADSTYAAAVTRLAAGDSAGAHAAFARARDLDVIRFRAPAAFVDVAKRVAEREGAVYVPVAERFAAASPAGSPGKELFLEHVHVTAEGSFLIAEVFLEEMLESPPPGRRADRALLQDPEVYRRGRGLTPLDERVVHHRLRALTARWPFVPAERQGDYFGTQIPGDRMDSLAFRVAAGVLPWELAKMEAGRGLASAGAVDAALAEFGGVILDSPENPSPWRASGEVLLRAGRNAAADSMLAEAMRRAPSVEVALLRAQLATDERRWADAVRQWQFVDGRRPNDAEVLYRLSLTSALAGDSTGARSTAARLARLAPRNPAHRDWVRMILPAP